MEKGIYDAYPVIVSGLYVEKRVLQDFFHVAK